VDHAVDPVAHVQAVVEGLQVDVRGAQVDHAANDGVDQADQPALRWPSSFRCSTKSPEIVLQAFKVNGRR
jgi:hypothetical protein